MVHCVAVIAWSHADFIRFHDPNMFVNTVSSLCVHETELPFKAIKSVQKVTTKHTY